MLDHLGFITTASKEVYILYFKRKGTWNLMNYSCYEKLEKYLANFCLNVQITDTERTADLILNEL